MDLEAGPERIAAVGVRGTRMWCFPVARAIGSIPVKGSVPLKKAS